MRSPDAHSVFLDVLIHLRLCRRPPIDVLEAFGILQAVGLSVFAEFVQKKMAHVFPIRRTIVIAEQWKPLAFFEETRTKLRPEIAAALRFTLDDGIDFLFDMRADIHHAVELLFRPGTEII